METNNEPERRGNMTAENQHFEVFPGDSHKLVISIANYEDKLKPLNIAGASFTWILSKSPYNTAVLTKTSEDGIKIIDPNLGVIEVSLLPTDTAKLKRGMPYSHQLKLKDSLEKGSTVTTGRCDVKN